MKIAAAATSDTTNASFRPLDPLTVRFRVEPAS